MSQYVSISPDEWSICVQVANARQVSSLKRGSSDALYKKSGWMEEFNIHIAGCVGELAVAKVLGVTWSGSVDTFKLPDLEGGVQVRHRTNQLWDLIVRHGDSDSEKFVLSRGMPPGLIEVAGWIVGANAKKEEYLKDWGNYSKPSYFVPAFKLNRMETIYEH